MKTLKLPLMALGCALLLSSAGMAQASSGNTTQKPTIQSDVDNPPPVWEPPAGPLSVNNDKAKQQFELYPNPATEKTTVVYTASTKASTLYVYNLIGNLVASFNLPEGNGVKEKVIDLGHLPKGYYLLKLGERSLKLSLH